MRALERRSFLKLVVGGATVGLIGCAGEKDWGSPSDDRDGGESGGGGDGGGHGGGGGDDAAAASNEPDAGAGCDAGFAVMHDTYAQALYLDGSLGPLTGVITVDQVI